MLPSEYGLTKAAYSVKETLNLLSVGRTQLYSLVNAGRLHPAKLGKKTLFTAPDIAQLLDELRAAGAAKAAAKAGAGDTSSAAEAL